MERGVIQVRPGNRLWETHNGWMMLERGWGPMKPIDILLQKHLFAIVLLNGNLLWKKSCSNSFVFQPRAHLWRNVLSTFGLLKTLYPSGIQVKLILLQPLFLCGISTLNPTPFPSEAPADWWLVRGLGSFGGKSLKHKSSKLWEGGGGSSEHPAGCREREGLINFTRVPWGPRGRGAGCTVMIRW